MATYLLVWNPAWFAWDDLQDDIQELRTTGESKGWWSCGNRKRIAHNDRVFLIKAIGKKRISGEQYGIVASGWAETPSGAEGPVEEGEHWDKAKRAAGGKALYVHICFNAILDPAEEAIFSREWLEEGIYSEMDWSPRTGGVAIPDHVAAKLEEDWAIFLGEPVPYKEVDFPEPMDATKTYTEGVTRRKLVHSYERSASARYDCIKVHGLNCCVCGFNFESEYGVIGKGYIHVHHLRPLSEIRRGYKLNPISDLRPVCPNCHAMLHHKQRTALSIDDLKTIIEQAKR